MDPNEKLLSFSRFQIGLSKADLQPTSEVCMTRTQLEVREFWKRRRSDWSRSFSSLLCPTYGPAGSILWKLPPTFASKLGRRNFLPMMLFIFLTSTV